MKVILEFSDEGECGMEEMRMARVAMNAEIYKNAFEEIWEQCFRPNNKHGYPGNDSILNKESSYDVIEALIEKFQEVNNGMLADLAE